jgi:hypothetical protein
MPENFFGTETSAFRSLPCALLSKLLPIVAPGQLWVFDAHPQRLPPQESMRIVYLDAEPLSNTN